MRTVAQISDLHFGVVDEAVAEGLASFLQAHPPRLIIVSGDLTQRARASQFQAAREFLDRLSSPKLIIPGNHDIPLYDVVRRFGAPLQYYKCIIQEELNPTFEDEELFVAGLNTARSFTWKSGRISEEQIAALAERLKSARDRFKIVVTHHPFIPSPLNRDARIDLGRAALALRVLEEYTVDLLLAGHLHHGYAGDTRSYFSAAQRTIISAQAGTAISRRVRHEPNAFNWITTDSESMTIEMMTWNGQTFVAAKTERYLKKSGSWIPA
jgi:3',5'-cyclic AMP phosphodiesterase CpdA